MRTVEHLGAAAARRIALAAQGFADRRPTGVPDRRHLRRVLRRTQLLQVDSVNVFERAHYLPAFSRLGPYPVAALDDMTYRHRELFEYWGHEASLLPVALHPLLRWRMARAEALEGGWERVRELARDRPGFVAEVLRRVEDEGPIGAGALRDGPRLGGSWWSWDDTKLALEHLFWSGRVTTSSRRSFERLYDVTERVLPAAVLALPTPSREQAQRELMLRAARAHGVATEKDLRDYFRLRPAEGAAALAALVADGEVVQVAVEGWRDPAYVVPGLVVPRRVHGYYVLPFLHDEAIRARIDLKNDRQAGVLRVLAAWLEPGHDAAPTAVALAAELRRAAHWQGLGEVVVEPRGTLAHALAALV